MRPLSTSNLPAQFGAENWRSEFPVTEKYAYLDHASVGPLPHKTVSKMMDTLSSQARNGSLDHPQLHDIAEEARGQFAALIGALPKQIAHVPSTSVGISIIARGLKLSPGDEVVVPAIDFPSAVLPWVMLEKEGVVVRRVRCFDGQVSIQDLVNACNSHTRVLSTSWIQFSSGFRLNLEALGAACHKRSIFLVVDGMQGVGAIDINVHDLPIDALVTQSYKWLLGPQGIGWLYMSDNLSKVTGLSAAGVRTGEPLESYFDHRLEPRSEVARFESGILDFHGIAGAMTSQSILMKIGLAQIEHKVVELADRLRSGLSDIGCEIAGGAKCAGLRSQIVAFRHPRKIPQVCNDALLHANIVTSVRENCVRVSPHFYNSNQEIDRLIELLK